MPRTKRRKITKVTALLPVSTELTKQKSGNSLVFTIKRGDIKLGTLCLGRGSVEWWPRSSKTKALKKTWVKFAQLMDEAM